MPDLSGTLGRELEAATARAKKLTEAGDTAGARKAYLRASKLALSYARSAPTSTIKKQRLERAKALRAKADKVGKERVRDHQGGRGDAGEDESGGADREQVRRLIAKSSVKWSDIAGLETVKSDLRTAYAMAVARAPSGVKISPARTILLYGPPGTGKTLLAQAVSTSLDATFFNIRTGDLLSSLFGKSPQLIQSVFDEAGAQAPSVIFFDEVEALVPSRDHDISAAEGRVVTAFLQALGGFGKDPDAPFVLSIGATNQPWRLDQAFLSRFARMVYVPLPDRECRLRIFELNLHSKGIRTELDADALADLADGYSGREIVQICEQAVAAAIRASNPDLEAVIGRGRDAVAGYELKLERIAPEHFREAFTQLKPVSDEGSLRRYADWARQQGA